MSARFTRVIDEMRDYSVMRCETARQPMGTAHDNAYRATHGMDDVTRSAIVRWASERAQAAYWAARADADLEAVLSEMPA